MAYTQQTLGVQSLLKRTPTPQQKAYFASSRKIFHLGQAQVPLPGAVGAGAVGTFWDLLLYITYLIAKACPLNVNFPTTALATTMLQYMVEH